MFSYRLKELRNRKSGLTQAKLAEVMNVSQQAVGLWERGKNMPSHELVAKLASFFNVSVDYLLGRTDEPGGTGFTRVPSQAASAHQQPSIRPDTLTPEEATLIQAYRNANDRDKSIVDTILKPEVRTQSEIVEDPPLSTAGHVG